MKKVEISRIEVGDSSNRCTSAQGPGKNATLKIPIDGADVGQQMKSEVRVFLNGNDIPLSIPGATHLDR